MSSTTQAADLNYGVDDVPKPFGRALALSLQHVLTMFGATIAVPLILAGPLGFDGAQTAILVSSAFIASGLATALQLTIGSRLPIVQGVSFAFLGAFFAIIGAHSGAEAMQYIAGGIILGGIVEAVVGYTGLIGTLQKYITPITIGPVIALIGLSLFGAAIGNVVSQVDPDTGATIAQGNWWIAILVIVLVFVFSLVLSDRNGFFALFPILLAVVTTYLVALVLSLAGAIDEGNRAYVTFDALSGTPWVRSVVGEQAVFFPWGLPKFDFGFFIAILAAYMASSIESIGDYNAVSRIAGLGKPDNTTVSKGIGSEGVGCVATAFVGGFASTSYSENIGLIGLSKVASRYVVLLGAGLLIVLGFVSKIGAVVATIPAPIVGGIYMALFGLIAGVGLSNLQHADMNSQRNLLIVGFLLFMGLAVPNYFGQVPADWTLFGQGWLTDIVRSIGSSGIAVAAVLGLFLDNLLPGTDEERGITAEAIADHPGSIS